MHTVRVRYGAIIDFLGALQTTTTMTEAMTKGMLEPELLAPSPAFTSALGQRNMNLDDVRQAGRIIRDGDQQAQQALAPFRAALALAGVFPKGHFMATDDDQVVEIVVSSDATRALMVAATTAAATLRIFAQGPPPVPGAPPPPPFLQTLFGIPLGKIDQSAPEVLKALLDAGAPLL